MRGIFELHVYQSVDLDQAPFQILRVLVQVMNRCGFEFATLCENLDGGLVPDETLAQRDNHAVDSDSLAGPQRYWRVGNWQPRRPTLAFAPGIVPFRVEEIEGQLGLDPMRFRAFGARQFPNLV